MSATPHISVPHSLDAPLPMTLPRLAEKQRLGEPIVMVTAYDYPSAQVAQDAGVDMVLVGDSGAMTVLGYPSTVPVSTDEMLMLASAVRRGLRTPLLVGDLPFGSYEASDEQAIATAQRFIKEAGCDAVKLERGGTSVQRARAIVEAGIPVMGHVGLDAADRDRARRPPGPGPHRGGGAHRRPGCDRAAGGRLFLDRLRGDPRGRGRARDGAAGDPGDRDRGRCGDRRSGARVPRPARDLRRPHGAIRQALRRRPGRDGGGRRAIRGRGPRAGRSPARSTSTRSTSLSWRSSAPGWRRSPTDRIGGPHGPVSLLPALHPSRPGVLRPVRGGGAQRGPHHGAAVRDARRLPRDEPDG